MRSGTRPRPTTCGCCGLDYVLGAYHHGSLEGACFIAAGSEQQRVDCYTVDSACQEGLMDNGFVEKNAMCTDVVAPQQRALARVRAAQCLAHRRWHHVTFERAAARRLRHGIWTTASLPARGTPLARLHSVWFFATGNLSTVSEQQVVDCDTVGSPRCAREQRRRLRREERRVHGRDTRMCPPTASRL